VRRVRGPGLQPRRGSVGPVPPPGGPRYFLGSGVLMLEAVLPGSSDRRHFVGRFPLPCGRGEGQDEGSFGGWVLNVECSMFGALHWLPLTPSLGGGGDALVAGLAPPTDEASATRASRSQWATRRRPSALLPATSDRAPFRQHAAGCDQMRVKSSCPNWLHQKTNHYSPEQKGKKLNNI
jgi:hypothetical protein